MAKSLKYLKKGDRVYCSGHNGFSDPYYDEVSKVKEEFDKRTGVKYNAIFLKGGGKFDSRDGKALKPPFVYYIKIPED